LNLPVDGRMDKGGIDLCQRSQRTSKTCRRKVLLDCDQRGQEIVGKSQRTVCYVPGVDYIGPVPKNAIQDAADAAARFGGVQVTHLGKY